MKRSEKVEELIRKHLILTTGLGLIPLPLLDIAAVTTSQVMMIRKMCDFYDIDFDDDSTKTILTSLTGSVLAKIGASIMKTIPIVGTFIGGASMAALSGASTYAVGHVFKKHFDEGGDLKSFDINAWKKYYEEMFEKGKTEAVKVEENKESFQDVFAKIERLSQLKDKGVITREEFQAKKEELLKDI